MDSILEEQRCFHEERERLTEAIMEEHLLTKPTRREKINSDHRITEYTQRYRDGTISLQKAYVDKSQQRATAINSMLGVDHRSQPFEAFYKRVEMLEKKHDDLQRRQNQVKSAKTKIVPKSGLTWEKNALEKNAVDIESHMSSLGHEFEKAERMRHILENGPNDPTVPGQAEFKRVLEETSTIVFSHEESYGKYFDMHHLHLEFLNIKGMPKDLNYLKYMEEFHEILESLDKNKFKKNSQYRQYLKNLIKYLKDYLQRVQPVFDQTLSEEKVRFEFNDEWIQGKVKGWEFASQGGALKKDAGILNMQDFDNESELVDLGLDRLKQALKAAGLKCGGTLEQRANRLWVTRDKAYADIPKKLKAPGGKTNNDQATADEKQLAWLECQVYKLVDLLDEYRNDTVDNIRRKAGRTADELEAEDENDESDEEVEVDDTMVGYNPNEESEIIYNPKNLPLDWDGKPIPYWLYKLHGLNISYECEICGGFKYRGLKCYQKHFAEWRHAHGMRCLNIPNTAHFSGVTKIEEAQKLWNKLKAEKQAERFKPETEEEFEDQLGNVLNKKTFDDLRRQGLC